MTYSEWRHSVDPCALLQLYDTLMCIMRTGGDAEEHFARTTGLAEDDIYDLLAEVSLWT